MNRSLAHGALVGLALVLVVVVGPGLAQGPGLLGEEGGSQLDARTAFISPTMSYQGRLVENGSPVDGTRPMTFRLYNAPSGGVKSWEEGPKPVSVDSGLFHVTLGDTAPLNPNNMDQELWLEIQVGGTILPRQKLHGAPYAFSLVPGADVSGDIGAGFSVLYVYNAGAGTGLLGRSVAGMGVTGDSTSGHGVYAESNGPGLGGAALKAENKNTTNGIAIWGINDSADATLALSNEGTGNLVKGFGGDGGEDEFRIHNDGTFETKADSYLFIPGTAFIRNQDGDTTRWDCQLNGSVRIWSGSTTGYKAIYIPITLPGVLYGRAVEVEKITIYYRCQDGANSYIRGTYLRKQIDADSGTVLVSDTTDRTSNTATSYTLDVNDTLSSSQGILAFFLNLMFSDDAHYLQIGGVRLQLGHHHLY